MNKTLVLVFVGIVFVAGGLLYIYNPEPVEYKPGDSDKKKQIFCTQDAMQCPDGSWVSRIGPNCEFVCPIPEGAMMEDGTL